MASGHLPSLKHRIRDNDELALVSVNYDCYYSYLTHLIYFKLNLLLYRNCIIIYATLRATSTEQYTVQCILYSGIYSVEIRGSICVTRILFNLMSNYTEYTLTYTVLYGTSVRETRVQVHELQYIRVSVEILNQYELLRESRAASDLLEFIAPGSEGKRLSHVSESSG